MMRLVIGFLIVFFTVINAGHAQVWQWSVELDSVLSTETKQHPRAFLWIPENCKQVRGVVVGQHNMLEEGILEHPQFRKTLTQLRFAEVWVTPMFNQNFDFYKDAIPVFEGMMRKLADSSGYTELAFAPVVPIGHSALATYPWNFAAALPQRTMAILSIHGDAPLTNLTGYGRPNLDWGNRTIDGIPGLMVEGEYEWWTARIKPALAYRHQHPQAAVSFLGDAGRGHFDYSDKLVDYLCLFLRKTALYRLPATLPIKKPFTLLPIDPAKGWLADRFNPDSLPQAEAAPYGSYRGDKREAFWYFDKEMAIATEKYYAVVRGKKNRYISFTQGDSLLPFHSSQHARFTLVFSPLPDGVSFHIGAVFTDSLHTAPAPEQAGGKINISRICGPVQKINDTTFTVRFYRMGFNNSKRSGDIWILAESNGDARNKSTVQQANMHIPVVNREGMAQTITFPKIGNLKVSTRSLPLNATTSSGLPVYYYVLEGPAEIQNNRLVMSKIPPRSLFPVKITVIAWQYGRDTAPQVQSAIPVSQTFFVDKN